jgi:hypothetical protein
MYSVRPRVTSLPFKGEDRRGMGILCTCGYLCIASDKWCIAGDKSSIAGDKSYIAGDE